MYDAVYSVATGDVAGVGVELAAEPRADGKGTEVTFTTIFEGSPAEAAGLKARIASRPCVATQLYSAVHYTQLYGYTARYFIQPMQHPLPEGWRRAAGGGR